MVSFKSSLHDERDGACKALLYEDRTFRRCDAGTQRIAHDFCYDHWLDLDTVGMARFPPFTESGETRAAVAQRTIFLLSPKQMADYAARRPSLNGLVTDGILVKTMVPSPSWVKQDACHVKNGGTFAVYAIRAGDGSIYIGQTRREAAHRFADHQSGKGAKYLKERGILGDGPIWSVQVTSRVLALQLEETIKAVVERLGIRVSVGEHVD